MFFTVSLPNSPPIVPAMEKNRKILPFHQTRALSSRDIKSRVRYRKSAIRKGAMPKQKFGVEHAVQVVGGRPSIVISAASSARSFKETKYRRTVIRTGAQRAGTTEGRLALIRWKIRFIDKAHRSIASGNCHIRFWPVTCLMACLRLAPRQPWSRRENRRNLPREWPRASQPSAPGNRRD